MNTKTRLFGGFASALAMTTISSSCSKPAETVAVPSNAVERAASFQGGAEITPADLTATPAALPDAPPAYNYDPVNPNITHKEYARFAWRQFIHLNSPAQKSGTNEAGKSPVVRGTIDPARNFVASGAKDFYQSGQTAGSSASSNLLVWETFAHRSELFPTGSAPSGDLPTLAPAYTFQNVEVDPASALFNNLDETTQIGQNQIFFPKDGNTPAANPYDDHMILFQAKVNQVEFDYIKSIYNAQNPPQALELPPNGNDQGESIEVKSAWREMTPALIASGRYHTAEALYYTQDASGKTQAQVKTFGLVGLHILRKMENYPAFVYTTFEQADNLSTPGGQDTGLYVITLYDEMAYDASVPPGTRPQAIINSGPNRTQVALPLAGPVDTANGYDIIHGSFKVPSGFAGPIKVQNPPVATFDVYEVNQEVQRAMARTPGLEDSVWQYYRLVGIQVLPTNEDSSITAPPNPLTQDFYLANIVIESSQPGIQLFKGGVVDPEPDKRDFNLLNRRGLANILNVKELPGDDTLVMGGCMGCHGNAQYPRDANGKGPSIFNFLISADTMTGSGFSADERNEPPGGLRRKVLEYPLYDR
jgi:hypothetical protein